MKKALALLLIAVMALSMFALTGCSKDEPAQGEDEGGDATGLTDWAYVEDKGELIIGLDDTFAPMGFRDEAGTLVGFDIDLANAVGEQLGIAVKFQPIVWDTKELELSSKRIDCIWNGMSATQERQENMSLTDKYLNNKIVLMTMKDDVKVTSGADLANYKVGTQVDSAALEMMQADADWDKFSANVTEYKDYDTAILDMKAGRIDCIAVDQVLGEYKNTKLDNAMKVCEFNFGDDFYAIGCRKGDVELAAKISGAIQALIDNGQAEEISNKWFGTNIVILEGYDQ